MNIGINLLYLIPGVVGGTETYAAGLLHGLANTDTDNKFIVFVNQEAAEWPLPLKSNFFRIICPVKGSNRVQRYYYEQAWLPRLLRHNQIDLVHSLGYVGPIFTPCPAVVTIPDLNYVDLALTMSPYRRFALRLISTQAAHTAKAVITISEFSKARINESLKLPIEKIAVTYLAPHPEAILAEDENWIELTRRYGIKIPYIVAFGGGTVHKNIPRLIQAFAGLENQHSHDLVLIGRIPSDVNLEKLSLTRNAGVRIVTTGYIPRFHINALLSHADLFVLPSLYEGFGLPVLEAQQANVAIACSIAGSLPEVAGEGTAYFDPTSVEAIAQTIVNCLSNADLLAKLKRLGKENLKRFSWEKTASETLAVYQRVLQRNQ